MKFLTPVVLALTLISLTACNQPRSNPREAQMEAHLERIEGHLARIEEALVKQAEANVAAQAAQAAQAVQAAQAPAAPVEPQDISVYVYGEGVNEPGEKIVREGSSVIAVLTASGAYGEIKPRDVTIMRPGHPDALLEREDQWKAFVIETGDVINVRHSVF